MVGKKSVKTLEGIRNILCLAPIGPKTSFRLSGISIYLLSFKNWVGIFSLKMPKLRISAFSYKN